MNQTANAKSYQRGKHRLFFTGLTLDLVVLLLFFLSGLSLSLREISFRCSPLSFIANGIYIFILSWGMYGIHLPLDFLGGFIWEHKFKLSTQSFGKWFIDDLKKSVIGFILVLLLVEVIYFLLGQYPRHWWVGAGLFWLFLTFVLTKLTPNVIIPLFFKYSPVESRELKERIMTLFQSCKVPLKEVAAINLSTKTKKANAFLCGLGGNRRVVLSDTLVAHFSIPEIETVVAHEIAHYKNKDILRFLGVHTLVIFFGFFGMHLLFEKGLVQFGLKRIDDIAFLPVMAMGFMVFGILTTPLINGYSRRREKRADQFSIETTQNPRGFISMMNKLAEMNLAEYKPGRLVELFFYDHPPVSKRVELAEQYLKA